MYFVRFHADAAETIYAICRVLSASLLAACLIALFAIAFFELIKARLRREAQQKTLARWRKRLSGADFPSRIELPVWAKVSYDWSADVEKSVTTRVRDLLTQGDATDLLCHGIAFKRYSSNALFMRAVQIAAEQALSEPLHFGRALEVFARTAPEDSLNSLILADFLRREDPHRFQELTAPAAKGDSEAMLAIAAAQDEVGRAIERELDELQLAVEGRWRRHIRIGYFGLSLMVAFAAPWFELGLKAASGAIIPVAVGLGLIGGVIALGCADIWMKFSGPRAG